MRGIVAKIVQDRGFGFIESQGSPDTFFHVSALMGIDFDEQLVGRRVEFETVVGEHGKQRAIRVQATN